jgi:hypothetical protein
MGEFVYNGKTYSIMSFGHAMGIDISVGFSALMIKGNPSSFNPNELEGWSRQNNYSIWYGSKSVETPFRRDALGAYDLSTYRSKALGPSIGASFLSWSRYTGYTWISEVKKGPTLYDLYKAKPY